MAGRAAQGVAVVGALFLSSFTLSCGDGSTSDPTGPTSAPAAPSNLVATPSDVAVQLNWQDNSGNETHFLIERRGSSGGWNALAQVPAGVNQHRDTDLPHAGTYTYRVGACNEAGCSASSNEASAAVESKVTHLVPFGVPAGVEYGSWVEIGVTVTDQFAQPLAGVSVKWAVTNGGGELSASQTESGSDGRASVEWTPGRLSKTQTVSATSDEGVSKSIQLDLANALLIGQLFTADQKPFQGLRAFVTEGEYLDSTDVESNGRFSLLGPPGLDSVTAYVDAADRGSRSYHPSLLRVSSSDNEELRLVLVPRTWTLVSGTYAGTTVDISTDAAFAHVDYHVATFYHQTYATDSTAWRAQPLSWPPSSFPIPVGFNRESSVPPDITPEDSATFWTTVDTFEADFGADLFRPIRWEDMPREEQNDRILGIEIRVDSTKWWGGLGGPKIYWREDAPWGEDISAGFAWLQRPSLFDGVNLVLAHELVHALGFGHSCAWRTIMTGGGFCGGTGGGPRVTAEDVAYMHVMSAVREAQKANEAPYGIPEAFAGERVLMLDLPPYNVSTRGAAPVPDDIIRSPR